MYYTMLSYALIHHTGDLYEYKNDPFLYRYAYGSFPCGSRLWSSPVLCIIHNSGYIFISMHITQKAL